MTTGGAQWSNFLGVIFVMMNLHCRENVELRGMRVSLTTLLCPIQVSQHIIYHTLEPRRETIQNTLVSEYVKMRSLGNATKTVTATPR